MAGKQLQASEKKVLKISRDGAVERNLVQDSETRISQRTEDAVLKAEDPADELFGKDHKSQEQAEHSKPHKEHSLLTKDSPRITQATLPNRRKTVRY
jgi:hypothetical protein